MNKNALVTPVEIRLTIAGMKASIVQVLTDYQGQLAEGIKQATVAYLDNFDWEAAVREEVHLILRNSISYHIREAVQTAFAQRIADAAREATEKIWPKEE